MIPICIFGNDEDETLGQIIKKAISPFGTTVYNTDKHSDEMYDNCSFYIKEQEVCSNLKSPGGIAVFKDVDGSFSLVEGPLSQAEYINRHVKD